MSSSNKIYSIWKTSFESVVLNSGGPREYFWKSVGQNYFNNNFKMLFAFFTILTLYLIVTKISGKIVYRWLVCSDLSLLSKKKETKKYFEIYSTERMLTTFSSVSVYTELEFSFKECDLNISYLSLSCQH